MKVTDHVIPLRVATPRLAAGAGLLQGAGARILYLPPRYAPLRRTRRDIPRLFAMTSDARFETREFESREGCRRPLEYRRPAGGFPPFAFAKDPPRASLRRCESLSRLSLTSVLSTDAPKPQFALDDYVEIDSKTDASSIRERAGSVSSQKEKIIESSGRLERKILNTERYNNGAAAPLLGRRRRRSLGSASPRRRSASPRRPHAAQRATIRALLASSALFYALAFIAFYFLSLA